MEVTVRLFAMLREDVNCVFDRDPAARVVVLTGAGKSFCAGGDLSVLPTFDHYTVVDWMGRTGQDIVRAITENEKVVVAKVKGHCIAGGLELALACDLIYASERTKFIFFASP